VLKVRVRGLHAQNRKAETGRVGDRCALNLTGDGVSRDAIARGDMILDPGLHAPTDRIDARLRVLASEKRPVTQWMPARLHHATGDVAARIVLLSDQPIAPGEEACVQLVLERPIAAASGDRFVLRDTTAQRTMAGGTLLDLRAPARRRRSPERLALLDAHGLADDRAALEALLARPPLFVDPVAFARDRAMSPRRFAEIAGELGLVQIDTQSLSLVLSPATWLRLKRSLLAALEEFHEKNPDLAGIGMERLRLQLQPRLPAPAFAALLQALTRDGVTALDGAWVKLPGHVVRLSARDEALWERTEPILGGEARFRPPRVRDIAQLLDENEVDIRRLFKMLSRMGKVDEIAQDHFFLRATVAEIVDISREIAERSDDRQLSAAQLRDRLDCGRKVAIFILEFFDRHGVTIRRGDLRRINKHRLDLFSVQSREAMVEAIAGSGGDASPVGRPDFKSGRGREPVLGGFDSHSLPPYH
jgi:selenocysteine-specific elongation factor